MPSFNPSVSVPAGLGAALLALATGCMGAHIQAGPTIGYAFKRGTTIGWEAGAGTIGFVRASTGGTYRLEPAPAPEEERAAAAQSEQPGGDASDAAPGGEVSAHVNESPSPDAIHYVALEPLGVSLGITFPNVGKPGFPGRRLGRLGLRPKPGGRFWVHGKPRPASAEL